MESEKVCILHNIHRWKMIVSEIQACCVNDNNLTMNSLVDESQKTKSTNAIGLGLGLYIFYAYGVFTAGFNTYSTSQTLLMRKTTLSVLPRPTETVSQAPRT